MSVVALLLALLLVATGIDRTVDPKLTAIAERRVVEIQADFSHTGYDPCCAEIIAWNAGHVDPLAHAVEQWRGSPPHWAILTDPSYTAIGCAVAQVDVRTFAVCVLASGASDTEPSIPAPTAAGGDRSGTVTAEASDAYEDNTARRIPQPVVAVIPDAAMAAP